MTDYDFKVGEECVISNASPQTHTTTPPPRYTEPQLVAKMEELGIGRPSTYANLVTVNQKRGYVQKKGKAMVPTWTGMKVAQILDATMPDFIDYGFTAHMEDQLDDIASGKITLKEFLDTAWKGSDGIDRKVNGLAKNINWDEVNTLSEIHLNGGYVVRVNKAGAWLEDPSGQKNDDGYVKSVRLDDDALTSEDALSPNACKKLLADAKPIVNHVLGVLSDGPYAGYQLTAKSGKYGAYVQAVKLNTKGAPVKSAKPVNMTIPDGYDENTITFDAASKLFSEIKLPRQIGEGYFTGIGKRGPWIGFKKTPKGRAQFISLPDGNDPRTITLDDVKTIWEQNPPKPRTYRRSKKK
jgi:DNA topoisomerase-1